MQMKGSLAAFALGCALLGGCAGSSKPVMVPLEIQNMQSREFKESKKIVFPAIVSVFQDLGYNIKSADFLTGFINAESPTQGRTVFGRGQVSSHTTATAFVEEYGKGSRVRLNFLFQEKASMYGDVKQKDAPVLDTQVYANAYERIENAVFMRTSK